MSGPDGNYDGAPCKALGNVAQRAVYTGYKKCHGSKVETVFLPNGTAPFLDLHQPVSMTLAVCCR